MIKYLKSLFWYMISRDIRVEKIGIRDNWYISTNVLPASPVMIAAGVGFTMTFELEFAKKFVHSKIFLLDPSETGLNTVRLITLPDNITFISKALGGHHGFMEFGLPDNPEEGSFISGTLSKDYCNNRVKFPSTSVENLIEKFALNSVDILKMDIEGGEFDVLKNLIKNKIYPRQICLEFHTNKDISIRLTTLDYFKTLFILWLHGYYVIYRKGKDLTLLNGKK